MLSFQIQVRAVFLVTAAVFTSCYARAQEIKSEPGQYDYYLLNLSWAPEFAAHCTR